MAKIIVMPRPAAYPRSRAERFHIAGLGDPRTIRLVDRRYVDLPMARLGSESFHDTARP